MIRPTLSILTRVLLAALLPLFVTLGVVLLVATHAMCDDHSADTAAEHAEVVFRTAVLISLAGFVLTGVSVFFTVRSIVNPIRRITREAGWIAGGTLDVFADNFSRRKRPRHEIDQLETALGKMLTELNAAHKTRLAAMETEYESEFARFVHGIAERAPSPGGEAGSPGEPGKENRPEGDVDVLLAGVASLRGALGRGDMDECRKVLDGMSGRYFGEETEADLLEIRGFVDRRGFTDARNFLESRFGR